MKLSEVQEFAREENVRLLKNYYRDYDQEKRIYAAMVKITEEVGELGNEVLKHHNLQRSSKMIGHKEEHLGTEMADVVITVLLLADQLGIDLEKSLKQKIEKIENRYDSNGEVRANV